MNDTAIKLKAILDAPPEELRVLAEFYRNAIGRRQAAERRRTELQGHMQAAEVERVAALGAEEALQSALLASVDAARTPARERARAS